MLVAILALGRLDEPEQMDEEGMGSDDLLVAIESLMDASGGGLRTPYPEGIPPAEEEWTMLHLARREAHGTSNWSARGIVFGADSAALDAILAFGDLRTVGRVQSTSTAFRGAAAGERGQALWCSIAVRRFPRLASLLPLLVRPVDHLALLRRDLAAARRGGGGFAPEPKWPYPPPRDDVENKLQERRHQRVDPSDGSEYTLEEFIGEYGGDVLQRLADLAGEVVGFELLIAIPADLPGDVDLPSLGGDTVGKAFGGFPIGRMQDFMGRGFTHVAVSSFNRNRCTLPVAVLGSASMNLTERGYL